MVEEETSMSLEILHQVGCRKMQGVMQWWAGGRWKETRSRGPASSIEINLAIELASQIDKLCHKCWSCSRCRYSIFRGIIIQERAQWRFSERSNPGPWDQGSSPLLKPNKALTGKWSKVYLATPSTWSKVTEL